MTLSAVEKSSTLVSLLGTATVMQPAAFPALMPLSESSMTKHSEAGRLNLLTASR